jgi:O-acetyl-ADP-ribose deacetylase (regulator of RNase III)
MKRIVRLTESDLARIVRRVIKEQEMKSEDLKLVPGLIGVVRVGDNEGVQYIINKVTPLNCGWMEVEIKRGAKFTYRYFEPSEDVNAEQRSIELSRFGEGVKAQDPCQQYVDFERYKESVQFGTKPGEVPNIYQ